MTRPTGERGVFRVQLPSGLSHPARYAAALHKHLGRHWRVRCIGYEENAEVKRLQKIIDGLAARVAAQSKLLSRRAEREEKR
jgi:hypothetical protein